MAQTKCPHCGFLNFAISAYCGRCERPLRVETPTVVTTTPSEHTIRAMPPRAPKTHLVAPPARPTAPLVSDKPEGTEQPEAGLAPDVHEEKTVVAPFNLMDLHNDETVVDQRPDHLRVPDAARPRQTQPTAAELAKEARDNERAAAQRAADRAQVQGRGAERPTERSGERPTERSGERPAERSGERPAERSAERPTERGPEVTRTAIGRMPQRPTQEPPVEKTVIDANFSRPTLKIPEEPAFTRDKPEAPSPASLFDRLTPKVEAPAKASGGASAASASKPADNQASARGEAESRGQKASGRRSSLEDLAGFEPSSEPASKPAAEKGRDDGRETRTREPRPQEQSLSMRENVQPEEVRNILRADPKEAERAVRVQATTINFDPSAPTQMTASSPALWQVAAATALDASLVVLIGLSIAAAEMLVFDVHWPADAQGLDALAIWLHIYPGTAFRALGGMVMFAFIYNVVGSRRGRTVGRALLGLRLVRREGTAVPWYGAVIRGVFSLVSIGFFGAGYFWMLMDTQHRTWGDLASRAVVVRR